jgi:hypothetical protein
MNRGRKPIPIIDGHKKCTKCLENKSLSEFNKKRDYFDSRCRICKSRKRAYKKYLKYKDFDEGKYIVLKTLQEFKCAICEVETDLVIDHDHVTGEVRGLLCNNCNWLLGHAKDSKTTLFSAILYLEKHEAVMKNRKEPKPEKLSELKPENISPELTKPIITEQFRARSYRQQYRKLS